MRETGRIIDSGKGSLKTREVIHEMRSVRSQGKVGSVMHRKVKTSSGGLL